jgi:hypothetical protein
MPLFSKKKKAGPQSVSPAPPISSAPTPMPSPAPSLAPTPMEEGPAPVPTDASTSVVVESGAAQLLSTAFPDGLSNPFASAQGGWITGLQEINGYTGAPGGGGDSWGAYTLGEAVDSFTGLAPADENANAYVGSKNVDPSTGIENAGSFTAGDARIDPLQELASNAGMSTGSSDDAEAAAWAAAHPLQAQPPWDTSVTPPANQQYEQGNARSDSDLLLLWAIREAVGVSEAGDLPAIPPPPAGGPGNISDVLSGTDWMSLLGNSGSPSPAAMPPATGQPAPAASPTQVAGSPTSPPDLQSTNAPDDLLSRPYPTIPGGVGVGGHQTAGSGAVTTYNSFLRSDYIDQIHAASNDALEQIANAGKLNDLAMAEQAARDASVFRNTTRTATQQLLTPGSRYMSQIIEQDRSWETIFNKYGGNRSFDTYEAIARKAGSSSPAVTFLAQAGKYGGPAAVGFGIGVAGLNISNAPSEERPRVAFVEAGGFAGGAIGADAGVAAGTGVGAFIAGALGLATGPAGLVALALGVLGGFLGGGVGSEAGRGAAGYAADAPAKFLSDGLQKEYETFHEQYPDATPFDYQRLRESGDGYLGDSMPLY